MGNDLADAIRAELRSALLAKYGTLEAAAEALDMPYKTLRRHLTTVGKDRTARVTLDFVLETAAQLERVSGVGFAEIYRRAELGLNVPTSVEDLDMREPRTMYGLAASEGEIAADQPHAD